MRFLKNIPAEPKGEVTHPLLDKMANWLILGLFSASAFIVVIHFI